MKAAILRIKDKIEDDVRQRRNAADLPNNFARPLPAVDFDATIPSGLVGSTLVPAGTVRLDNLYQNQIGGFMTKIVSPADHGHDIVPGPDNNGLIRLLAPNGAPSALQAGTQPPPAMNSSNLITLSLFLRSAAYGKYVAPNTRKETTNKYFAPQILTCMLARELGMGVRMYVDKYTYDFFHLVPCNWIDFQGCLPGKGSYNLQDPDLDRRTDELHDTLNANMTKVYDMWRSFMGTWNMADAMCHIMWYILSGYDADYVQNWHKSAQMMIVDTYALRPEWHEDITIKLPDGDRRFWMDHKSDEKYRVVFHEGYICSVWRLFGMRQRRPITCIVDGTDVTIAPPQSIHIRDCHTDPPSFGDYQHSVVDFAKTGKAYEWCVSPGVYKVPWGDFTGKSTMHTAICCYVNAQRTGTDPCIMNDEDYAQSVGLIWNREFMDQVRQHRRYKSDHLPAHKDDWTYYGIDEIVLAQATGPMDVSIPSSVQDPWSACYNDMGCRSQHPYLKSVTPLTEWERRVNPLSERANRANNTIVPKSVVLPLVWQWATAPLWMAIKGDSQGSRDKGAMSKYSVGTANLASTYFFPISHTRRTHWFPKASCPGMFTRLAGNAGLNFVGGRMTGGGDPVTGLMAALMSDIPVSWEAAGYAGLPEFVAQHPVADELFADGAAVMAAYRDFESSPMAIKPFDLSDDPLRDMKASYQAIVESYSKACDL
jgi:hypothetical protein